MDMLDCVFARLLLRASLNSLTLLFMILLVFIKLVNNRHIIGRAKGYSIFIMVLTV